MPEIATCPLDTLVLSPLNPRTVAIDEAEIAALAESIAAIGLQQNLIGVDGATAIEIVGGGRRLRALTRLLAEGRDTVEIASILCYSERTVKGVIHGITSRLQLRNRSHAVAYALRNGLVNVL